MTREEIIEMLNWHPSHARTHGGSEGLLARLEQGPATAHELAMLVDVDSTFHVAGLLKYHRNIGRVTLERGRYAMNEQFTDPAIWRAAELLRRAGWTVVAP